MQIIWVIFPSYCRPVERRLFTRLPQNKLASFEGGGQSDDECADVVLPAWCILMRFEHAPGTIGVNLVEFGRDRKVDQARNTGNDSIRNPHRIKINAKRLSG